VIIVLKPCQRELLVLPAEVRADLADALARLDAGLTLSMPLSRPMRTIGPGVHELRLKERSGQYRVIYAVIERDNYLRAPCVQENDRDDAAAHHPIGAAAAQGGKAMKRATSARRLAAQLGIPKSRGLEAVMKAQLIAAVSREVERQKVTHAELAQRSGLPRSAVTGILSGSLQKVTIDRVLRLVDAVGLEAEIKVRRAA
jgi:predicted XRE-type DNA-binding protein